ncbi:MAG TPA: bifunctional tetrahydrofolate synthase/dihydrofolate synthase [Candidatus Competibacteraceae bacterium]|nr:bifunctional tetrahydrofolate synthase/dihydrofolate synthase [Candidatus Competibacteraceae bacterium]
MAQPRYTTLEQWLAWQETLHPRAIDLGLERVRQVAQRLGLLDRPAFTIITVGGTNGKGSCVALLEAILRAAGYKTGAYTSPHLLRYNERIRLDGVTVDDASLCEAFARIDAARKDISLTYFEFGTLAALWLFQQVGVQVALLEVGLGGRLDAVNVMDADAALITAVAIDHVEWLGQDRDSIGYEKAGIYRPGRPAICADPLPPTGLLKQAYAIGARLYLTNRDYGFCCQGQQWSWWCETIRLDALPLPALPGVHQLGNAAGVLMTLQALAERLPVPVEAIKAGLKQVNIAARFQILAGPVEWILDVAHNPHAATVLADTLHARTCSGRTRAVWAMLSDKDAPGVAHALADSVDCWYPATLEGPRGRPGEHLLAILQDAGGKGTIQHYPSVAAACRAAWQEASNGDRILVFGSFHTVAQALLWSGLDGGDAFSATRPLEM